MFNVSEDIDFVFDYMLVKDIFDYICLRLFVY